MTILIFKLSPIEYCHSKLQSHKYWNGMGTDNDLLKEGDVTEVGDNLSMFVFRNSSYHFETVFFSFQNSH